MYRSKNIGWIREMPIRAICGTASRGSPTAATDNRPTRRRSTKAPTMPIASRTAGPIIMCQDSGGIQEICPD